MTEKELLRYVESGENLRVEFKESRDKLPANLFETICAFLNTKGGVILLGVADKGEIIGVDKAAVEKLKKEMVSLANNPQKLSPTIVLSIEEIDIDGKIVLAVKVPESSHVHKTNNDIFVRNQDGDFRVTRPVEIAKIVNRKQNYYSEQTVFPEIAFADFKQQLIARAKQLIKSNNPTHHWQELDDKSLLARAGFYRKEKSGKEGYTLAAILFFGTDDLIQSVLPAYKFEALLRRENVDRYDDRLTVRTNLLDAYDLLMGFIEKHLNDPFYLEGDMRVSLRSKIFRELVVNSIAHREYMHPAPAMIQIFSDSVEFTNPNNPVVFGKIDPDHFTPIAKNPTISKFLLQMGLVEEVGSGMRNVYKYLPHYSKGATVEFVDGEPFKTIIKLGETSEKSSEKGSQKGSQKSSQKILDLIHQNSSITTTEMAEILKISRRAVAKHIANLKKQGIVKRIGPAKGGYWKVVEGKKD